MIGLKRRFWRRNGEVQEAEERLSGEGACDERAWKARFGMIYVDVHSSSPLALPKDCTFCEH